MIIIIIIIIIMIITIIIIVIMIIIIINIYWWKKTLSSDSPLLISVNKENLHTLISLTSIVNNFWGLLFLTALLFLWLKILDLHMLIL